MRPLTRNLTIAEATFEYRIGSKFIVWCSFDGFNFRNVHQCQNPILNDSDAFEECLNWYDENKEQAAYLKQQLFEFMRNQ